MKTQQKSLVNTFWLGIYAVDPGTTADIELVDVFLKIFLHVFMFSLSRKSLLSGKIESGNFFYAIPFFWRNFHKKAIVFCCYFRFQFLHFFTATAIKIDKNTFLCCISFPFEVVVMLYIT